eukprot:4425431-Amphidinium_carterae.1
MYQKIVSRTVVVIVALAQLWSDTGQSILLLPCPEFYTLLSRPGLRSYGMSHNAHAARTSPTRLNVQCIMSEVQIGKTKPSSQIQLRTEAGQNYPTILSHYIADSSGYDKESQMKPKEYKEPNCCDDIETHARTKSSYFRRLPNFSCVLQFSPLELVCASFEGRFGN